MDFLAHTSRLKKRAYLQSLTMTAEIPMPSRKWFTFGCPEDVYVYLTILVVGKFMILFLL